MKTFPNGYANGFFCDTVHPSKYGTNCTKRYMPEDNANSFTSRVGDGDCGGEFTPNRGDGNGMYPYNLFLQTSD